jgi:aspartyl/asparaginyl-tRNA synthetase
MSIPLVIWLLTRNSDKLSEVLENTKESHRKELEVIEKSHQEEIKKREEATLKYKETLSVVEKKYNDANRELTSKKRKEVEKVIKENANDPEEITKRLAEITGFDLHEE